eukprot:jgi/Orpsp1_1/1178737/evm.model.c7180000066542.1
MIRNDRAQPNRNTRDHHNHHGHHDHHGHYDSNLIKSKSKRDGGSSECQYINRMLGEDESYDCCENLYVFCDENNHIIV